jgi:hypothetical protein
MVDVPLQAPEFRELRQMASVAVPLKHSIKTDESFPLEACGNDRED